jgi:hypothetical protein
MVQIAGPARHGEGDKRAQVVNRELFQTVVEASFPQDQEQEAIAWLQHTCLEYTSEETSGIHCYDVTTRRVRRVAFEGVLHTGNSG